MSSGVKRLEEKGFVSAVSAAEWSEKMDLVAVGFHSGELSLFRLSWHKVWHLNTPSASSGCVKSISWRVSDSRVITVAYEKLSHISVIDINTSFCVHKLVLTEIPRFFKFILISKPETGSCKRQDSSFNDGDVALFLPPLPNISGSVAPDAVLYHEGQVENAKLLKPVKKLAIQHLDVLAVELPDFVYFYSGCMYPVFKLSKQSSDRIVNIAVSSSSKALMFLSLLDVDSSSVTCEMFDLSDLYSKLPELIEESDCIYDIIGCFEYITVVVQAMLDSWQDALGEIQLKLARFSLEKSSPGTVGDEFLMLLLFGKPSSELLVFLVNELTSKGCHSLRESVSSTYAGLSKLIVNHLIPAARAMLFHGQRLLKQGKKTLSGIRVKEEAVMKCVKVTGSLALKANEMLVVMEKSQAELDCFFKWLFYMLLKLSDETIPPELSQTSQQELAQVASFIKDNLNESVFTEQTPEGPKKRAVFRLEKVGQYLSKEWLKERISFENHSSMAKFWFGQFSEEEAVDDMADIVFDPCFDLSLRQVMMQLEGIITTDLSNAFCLHQSEVMLKHHQVSIDHKFELLSNLVPCFDTRFSEDVLYLSFYHKTKLYIVSSQCVKPLIGHENEFILRGLALNFRNSAEKSAAAFEVKSACCMGTKVCVLVQEKTDRICCYVVVLEANDLLQNSKAILLRCKKSTSENPSSVYSLATSKISSFQFPLNQLDFKDNPNFSFVCGVLVLSPGLDYSLLKVSSERKLASVCHQQNKRVLFLDLDAPLDEDEDVDCEDEDDDG